VRDDHRFDRLAPAFVGHTDHGGLRDPVELVQDVLDLAREDVLRP
jgi:hypothetical protein